MCLDAQKRYVAPGNAEPVPSWGPFNSTTLGTEDGHVTVSTEARKRSPQNPAFMSPPGQLAAEGGNSGQTSRVKHGTPETFPRPSETPDVAFLGVL